ncbi:MAG TPA: sigma-54-dependent Fis family transcriptional regulator, partial [Calditrichia bacterium]|nr:sigma-54-dependent Fis family transcriptional regulator [Calditrichia bacterium]
AVVLIDPAGKNEARTLIRQGEPETVTLDHFLNMMLSGWVHQHREPLCTDDITPIVGEANVKGKYRDIVSALSIPLSIKGEMIGTLSLIRLKAKEPFGERESDLLGILGTAFAQFIHHARLHDSIFEETLRLRKEVQTQYAFHGIIGKSPALQRVFKLLERVIPTDARLLIEGESGTGKELIAKVTHYGGPRREKPFVAVDCGALPANLLEAELFGYMKGAFTGAHKDKKGLFEIADGGTLFLDEISNMPLEIQSKFLRTLQEGEIRPLGSTQVKKVDVRIIAAGSGDLKKHVADGSFRQDLFYRLNVVSLKLPSLRERRGDVVILANHFLEKMAGRHQKQFKGFRAPLMARLESYAWPGNVRELENVVERMVILAEDNQDYLDESLLPLEITDTPAMAVRGGAMPLTPGPGD